MSRWFRWYEGTSEDGKFRVVARLSRVTVRDVIALWAFMLEDAASQKHRGVCHRNEDFMASVLDFADGEVERILSAMENVGMVSIGIGAITVCNWSKRQFESDADPTATKRQAIKRERDKATSNAHVTRDSRPPDNRVQNTETEKKEPIRSVASATRPVRDEVFEGFWGSYPKRDGSNPKAPARKLFEIAVKSGVDPQAIIAGARKYAADPATKVGTSYVAQAMTWLRQRRWEDQNATVVDATDELERHRRACLERKVDGETEVRRHPGVGESGAGEPGEFRSPVGVLWRKDQAVG